MARGLAGNEYQCLFRRGSRHSVGNAMQRFLPQTIEQVWQAYPEKEVK